MGNEESSNTGRQATLRAHSIGRGGFLFFGLVPAGTNISPVGAFGGYGFFGGRHRQGRINGPKFEKGRAPPHNSGWLAFQKH